jgi:hypothetical protein
VEQKTSLCLFILNSWFRILLGVFFLADKLCCYAEGRLRSRGA